MWMRSWFQKTLKCHIEFNLIHILEGIFSEIQQQVTTLKLIFDASKNYNKTFLKRKQIVVVL